MNNADTLGVLYITVNGAKYRVKVFAHSVWIERQTPRGDNVQFLRDTYNQADTLLEADNVWNLDATVAMIAIYETEQTAEDDTALNILGLVQSYEQTPMGKVWGISAKSLQAKSGLSESALDALLDALLSIGDLRIHPNNKGFVLGASGKERLSQTTPNTAEDGIDETPLTPSQADTIHKGIRQAIKARSAEGDISQSLDAWATAKRAITKTIEYGGFNSPFAETTKPEAISAIESASSLADTLRRLADSLERESESYRFMVEDMR